MRDFAGMPLAVILAAYDQAVRDGRIVSVKLEASNETALIIAAPIALKVYERAPDRCIERPHKKWPIRK